MGLDGTCAVGGGSIGIDHGTNGVFSPAVAAAAPEPFSLLLLATATLGGVGIVHRKLMA